MWVSASPRHRRSPSRPSLQAVPADTNPYGVAFVPRDFPRAGRLIPATSWSRTSTTASATCRGPARPSCESPPRTTIGLLHVQEPGLTTALGVLKSGFVIVGNLPTTRRHLKHDPARARSYPRPQRQRRHHAHRPHIARRALGPDRSTTRGADAQVFVSNVLSGTVTRIDLSVPRAAIRSFESVTQIASGYVTPHRPGSAGDRTDRPGLRRQERTPSTSPRRATTRSSPSRTRRDRTSDGGMGELVYQDDAHLRGPLGLVLAPNGDLITANGDAVNPDPNSDQRAGRVHAHGPICRRVLNPAQTSGSAFGIALGRSGDHLILLPSMTLPISSTCSRSTARGWSTDSGANPVIISGMAEARLTRPRPPNIAARSTNL